MKKLNFKPQIIFAVLPPLYIFGNFIRFYVESSLVFSLVTISIVFFGLFILAYALIKSHEKYILLMLLCPLLLFGLVTAVSENNATLLDIPQMFANIGFAWAAYHIRLNSRVFLNIFILLCVFFSTHIWSGSDPGDVFTVSRNFISIIIIISIGFYYLACDQNDQSPNLYVPIVGLIISLWAIGRSGIASAALICIGTLLVSKRNMRIGVMVGVLVATLFMLYDDLLTNFDILYVGLERWDRLGVDGQRSYIVAEYISLAVAKSSYFFWGVPLSAVSSIAEVNGNPHNSYIRLHASFGVFGVLFIAFVMALTIFLLFKQKKYLTLLIFFTASFRALFDSAAFHGPLDVMIFYGVISSFSGMRFRSINVNKNRWAF